MKISKNYIVVCNCRKYIYSDINTRILDLVKRKVIELPFFVLDELRNKLLPVENDYLTN